MLNKLLDFIDSGKELNICIEEISIGREIFDKILGEVHPSRVEQLSFGPLKDPQKRWEMEINGVRIHGKE